MVTRRRRADPSRPTRRRRVFKKKDFISGDGMLTAVWGPSAWHYLHTISFNYPVCPNHKDKQHYGDVIRNLVHTLPCKYCRENLKRTFDANPLRECHLADRQSFSRYVYQLHETVNKMLGKRSGLTYCDVRERYEHFRARCTDSKPKMMAKGRPKEKGCTEPLYGRKAKCLLKIVPAQHPCKTMTIDQSCKKRRA